MLPTKLTWSATVLLPLTATSLQAQDVRTPERPNFIFIMCDQQRADLCGREGYPLEVTPFADRMARRGIWFDKAYTPAPASVPARVSFVTGRYPAATRVWSNHNTPDAVYNDDLFSVARKGGYATALVGKNHSVIKPEQADYWSHYNHFGQQGKNLGEEALAVNRYLGSLDMYADYAPAPFPAEMQQPCRMVTDALDWIENKRDREKPFLMWLSFPEPHTPYQVSEPYYSMFPPEKLPKMRTDTTSLTRKGEKYLHLHEMETLGNPDYYEHLGRLRSNYLGMLRLIDDQLQRFITQLEKDGTFENTIFVLCADHGDFAGEYGLTKKGVSVPDVLSRIPMVIFGKGIPAQGLSRAHVSLVDLFPTFCEMAGQPIPAGVQGRSLAPLITREQYPAGEFRSVMTGDGYGGQYYTKEDGTDYAREGAMGKKPGRFDSLNSWTQSGQCRGVRMGDWKLIMDMLGHGELYNMKKDPSEVNNLFGNPKYALVQSEMLAELLRWNVATRDPLPYPHTRYRFKTNAHNYMFNPQ